MDTEGKPIAAPTAQPVPHRQANPRLRLAAGGFLLGIGAFSLLSIAAPLILAPLAQRLCVLPIGRHLPSAACYLVEALAFTLWLGPTALVWHALLPSAATLGGIRLTSGVFLGLLSAGFLAAYGRRRGTWITIGVSALLIAISTLISMMLVSSG